MTGEGGGLGRLQRWRVGQAVEEAEWLTGLQFCVYLGPAQEGDLRAQAEAMFVQAGLASRPAVLVMVAPARRHVEVVTSPSARERVDDDEAAAAVAEMTDHFSRGDFAGGLVAGVRRLAEGAGPGRPPPDAEQLPDVVQG